VRTLAAWILIGVAASCGPDPSSASAPPKAANAWSDARYAPSAPREGTTDERIRRGKEHLEKERYAEAAAEFREVASRDPKNADALEGLSQVAARMGDGASALTFISRAVELRPEDAALANQRGITFVMLQRRREAAAEFDRAISLRPDDPLIHLNAALNRADLGEWRVAEEHAKKAAERVPRDATPWLILGRFQVRQGKFSDAVAPLQEALRRSPDNALINYHLGKALSSAGRRAEAVTPLKAALVGNPPPEIRKEVEGLLAGR
jgi:Flp pilus assembly protein TadD